MKFSRLFFSVFVLTITLLTGVHSLAMAPAKSAQLLKQIDPRFLLNYILDYGGKAKSFDRYRLKIPAKEIYSPWQSLTIRYPSTFNGSIPENRIEVYVNGQVQSVANKYLDLENFFIQLDLENPIEPGSSDVMIVISAVKNPDAGTYPFSLSVVSTSIQLPRYIGTWEIQIFP